MPTSFKITAALSAIAIAAFQPAMGQPAAKAEAELHPIIVQSTRIRSDEQVSRQVAQALADDPYLDDRHLSVTTVNGVVTIHGFVQDAWDLLQLRRISKRVAGVRKVVNDVELMLNDQ